MFMCLYICMYLCSLVYNGIAYLHFLISIKYVIFVYTLLKIKVLPDAIEYFFCLNGS